VVEVDDVAGLSEVDEEADVGLDVEVDSSEAWVEVEPLDPEQAATTSSVANATLAKSGGRVGPPVPNNEHRGLKRLPPIPQPHQTLRSVSCARWVVDRSGVLHAYLRGAWTRPTRQPCQPPCHPASTLRSGHQGVKVASSPCSRITMNPVIRVSATLSETLQPAHDPSRPFVVHLPGVGGGKSTDLR